MYFISSFLSFKNKYAYEFYRLILALKIFSGKTFHCIATIELVVNCKKIDPSCMIVCGENA